MARWSKPKSERLTLTGDVLAETSRAVAMRLDADPKDRDSRAVTVLVGPDVTPAQAAANLRDLAAELERSG